jgi:hypothetical protein
VSTKKRRKKSKKSTNADAASTETNEAALTILEGKDEEDDDEDEEEDDEETFGQVFDEILSDEEKEMFHESVLMSPLSSKPGTAGGTTITASEDGDDEFSEPHAPINHFLGDMKHKSAVRVNALKQNNNKHQHQDEHLNMDDDEDDEDEEEEEDKNRQGEGEEEEGDLSHKTEAELLALLGPLRSRRSEGGLLNRKVRIICSGPLYHHRGKVIDFIKGGVYTVELDPKKLNKKFEKEQAAKQKNQQQQQSLIKSKSTVEKEQKDNEELLNLEEEFGKMAFEDDKQKKTKRKFIRIMWHDVEDYKHPKHEVAEETEEEKMKRERKLKRKEEKREERRANRPMAGLMPAKPHARKQKGKKDGVVE